MSTTPHTATGPTDAQVADAEESSRLIDAATAHLREADRPAVPPTGIDIQRTRAGWKIVSATELTNEQAQAITFRADPADVVMGDYVEVHDPEGVRAGDIYRATYRRQAFAPAYVSVEIDLR